MTQFRNLRIGDKFVLRNDMGAWKKISFTHAKCVFGDQQMYGIESNVSPDAEVFVIPREERRAATDIVPVDERRVQTVQVKGPEVPKPAEGSIVVCLVNENRDILHRVEMNHNWANLLPNAEAVTIPVNGSKESYFILGSAIDMAEEILYIEVSKT